MKKKKERYCTKIYNKNCEKLNGKNIHSMNEFIKNQPCHLFS